MYRRELKISGSIENSKNGISFVSLGRQVESALKRGHSKADVIDAVIKAIPHASPLREYIEGRSTISLESLRKVLRAHYHEKSAHELYQELGNTIQTGKEEAADFLLRLLALKHKILIVSQESNEVAYGENLINRTLRKTFHQGLRDEFIRTELRMCDIEGHGDEKLIEEVSKSISRQRERVNKLGKTKTVNRLTYEESEKRR